VDTLLAAKIAGTERSVRCGVQGHAVPPAGMGEHALEVQLPFLQQTLGKFKVVPIVMGEQSPERCGELARALAAAIGKRDDVLLVASSDLSHFHTYDEANALDGRLRAYVGDFNYQGLLAALGSGQVEACGGGPIAAVMTASRSLGADEARVLAHANSGDVTGEKDRVVGYLSAMLYRSAQVEKSSEPSSKPGGPMGLTDQEKKYLLQVARSTIIYSVAGGVKPDPKAITPVLAENRGAFVTIKKHGELRGCIGYIVAVKPLVETVQEMAVSAALRDPRFPPVDKSELKDLELEISVLTPIVKVEDPSTIQVGRDGLIIRRGPYQGLLLPQVATEYGWDRDTFLAQTCRKAGLPPDTWKKPGTEIFSFSAEVFGEEK
jgi:MEMO1 family protein